MSEALAHMHCRDPTHFSRQRHLGVQFFSCLREYGLRGVEGTFAAAPVFPPRLPLPTDVMSGEALSSEDRAKLDHEVSEFSKLMQAFWK